MLGSQKYYYHIVFFNTRCTSSLPPSSQSSAQNENTSVSDRSLSLRGSPSRGCGPSLSVLYTTLCHLVTPSLLNLILSATLAGAVCPLVAPHSTRLKPKPATGVADGNSRQNLSYSETACEVTYIRWNAGKMRTLPISALRFCGEAFVSAMKPARLPCQAGCAGSGRSLSIIASPTNEQSRRKLSRR